MNRPCKVIINCPEVTKRGGVANYYLGLKDKLPDYVKFYYTGGRYKKSLFFLNMISDYIGFIKVLIKEKPDLVHLNPSLDPKSILRDSVFIVISRIMDKKILVFWRGWHKSTEEKIDKRYKMFFRFFFDKVNMHLVLSSEFKNKLKNWGFRSPVKIETTKVDDELIKDFKIANKEYYKNVLYISRVEKAKGIYIAIDAVAALKEKGIKLLVAGEGKELENVKEYANKIFADNIEFLGYVEKEAKVKAFNDSSLYILPSDGEGMPNSMLEAMAFGLAVVSRPVGGVKDFFENGKMGYITESTDPAEYADIIRKLFSDKKILRDISLYNHNYAKERFYASKIALRLEKIYSEICS